MLAMRDNGRRARLARRLSAPLATMWWWLSLQCMRTQAPPRQRATTVSGSSGLPDFEVGLQPSQPWLKISRVGVSDLCRLHSIALDYIRLQRRHQNPKIMCRARVKASTTRRVTDKGDGTATLRLRALVLRPRSLRSPADQAPPHKTRPRAATGAQSARHTQKCLFCWMGCLCLATATRCASGARAGSSAPPTRHAHRHHRRHAPAACEGASESLVRVDGVGAPLPFSALGAGLDGEELDGLAAPGDFYELLGLDAGAACSDADVKAAYRRLQKVLA